MNPMILAHIGLTAVLCVFLGFAWKNTTWFNIVLKTLLMIGGVLGLMIVASSLGIAP